MVFGGPEKEEIQLNEETISAGQPYNNYNPEGPKYLQQVRELIWAGKSKEAQAIADKKLLSPVGRELPYQTAGSLNITFQGHEEYTDYHRELDIDNALVTTSYLSSVHNDDVQKQLDAKKLNHKECVMYRTVSNDFTEEEAKNFDCDMLVFFSPTGIKAFTKNFPDFKQGEVRIATFGPTTAKAVADEGFRLDLEAPTKEHPSMTSALRGYLENIK